MLFGVNDTVRRALQADGYVPAKFAEVWIGDTVVWEKGILADKGIRYFTIIDAEVKTSTYVDSGMGTDSTVAVEVTNTILDLVVRDEDGIYDTLSINVDHFTWVKQCEANIKLFGSIKERYEEL